MEIKPEHINFEQAKFIEKIAGIINYHTNEFPEQWQVVELLRLKHSIWIYCYFVEDNGSLNGGFCVNVQYGKPQKTITVNTGMKSPQEAISQGIDYALYNILK